ncbi:MAG: DUF3617 family protein [Gammaproteobacteria bacterium]|nr:DUF3617 family protein [Gammaproteobacteria bacterium]
MNGKRICALLVTCLLQAPVSSVVFASTPIKYGEWEVKASVEGLPVAVPDQTQRVCIDKAHLVPGEKQTHGCKINWQINSNVVSWKMQCDNGGNGSGKVVYSGDTMQGSSDISMPQTNMKLHSNVSGKWISATCSAASQTLPQASQSQ